MPHSNNQTKKNISKRHGTTTVVLCLLTLLTILIIVEQATAQTSKSSNSVQPQRIAAKPTIPTADRHEPGRVFLEYADQLKLDEKISSDYQILSGNVQFRKDDMFMYCDSAYFYEKTNSLDAFGNVKMEQGDTLFVYADELYYNGIEEMARLRHNVRMENRDVTLFTDSLNYDMRDEIGYYFEGGKIVDKVNELSSVYGQYIPNTKDAEFLFDVELYNENYVMHTDTLHYNTATHIANIVGPTVIESDSTTIHSSKGWYNTDNDQATLYDRSLIVTKQGNTLTGDTLYYDRQAGFGEAFGNMILTDSVRQSTIEGGYGYYNEREERSFATIRARILEYSQRDTLYLHGDTIRTYIDYSDSTHVMTAYPRVRFWRVDLQGLCDSMSFTERDTVLHMLRHPIVWNERRQVYGNIIQVHINDSTVDWAKLPDFGFVAEHVDEEFYNQLTGKELLAQFENGSMRTLDVNGNVEAIMLPMENDSTYNKIVNSQSSFMKAVFNKNRIERLNMWPEVTGKVTPLYLARKSIFYLPKFQWYDALRPKDKDDIFNVPPEMDALLSEPDTSTRRRRSN